MNDYKILFQVSGRSTLIQDERATELAEGDLGLVDVSRPINLVAHEGTGRWIGLHLPRWPLKANLGFEPQGGLCWRSDALPGRLPLRSILEAVDESGIVPGSAEPFMQGAVYNLVGALFGESELPRHFCQGDKLFARICSIVKRHFPDPDVGSAEVASEAGISVRYLQKLFAMRGTTCSHYVRSLRLDHAAQLLNRQTSTDRNILLAEIGQSCGYRDYANFARHFRARFGYAPGAFRNRGPSH
jgi:AraC family transcriptional regulator, positive regulator of tynA and feaB